MIHLLLVFWFVLLLSIALLCNPLISAEISMTLPKVMVAEACCDNYMVYSYVREKESRGMKERMG